MILIDIVIFLTVLFSGLEIAKRFDVAPWSTRTLQWLWVCHLFFGVVFWFYITYGPGGDAIGYWKVAGRVPFSAILPHMWTVPTVFMYAVCFPLANILNLSFFSTSMVFCLIGYAGVAFAYVTYERMVPYNAKIGQLMLFPLIFFLPNLHFWSSGVGKDSLLFFCIALFFFCLQNLKKNIVGLVVSLVLSYFVRPHVTLFMVVATGMGFALGGGLKAYQKVLILGVFVVCGVWLFGKMEAFIKVDELNAESFSQFAQSRASGLSGAHTGSAIDISSYPLPLKLFTFLFRPLFFDARNPLSLLASFENLLLVILSARVLASKPIAAFRRGNIVIKSAIIFVLIGSLGCSMVMSNLGIILRQKNMFIPALYLFIGWTLALKNIPAEEPPETTPR